MLQTLKIQQLSTESFERNYYKHSINAIKKYNDQETQRTCDPPTHKIFAMLEDGGSYRVP